MRIFIAIDLPEELQKTIKKAQEAIKTSLAGLKTVKNCHVTLKFLGDISEERLNHIKPLLRNIKLKPFSLKTAKLGVFPSENYIQVIWLGFHPNKELLKIKKSIDNALEYYFQKEKAFAPHITIARVKFIKEKQKFLETLNSIEIPESTFKVEAVKLYRSVLKSEGPEYTEMMSFS